MRSFKWGVGLLCVIVIFVSVNAIVLRRQINRNVSAAEALHVTADTDWGMQYSRVKAGFDAWKRDCKFISLTVNHHDIMETDTAYAQLSGAAEAGSYTEYMVAYHALTDSLGHISEQSKISFGTLF